MTRCFLTFPSGKTGLRADLYRKKGKARKKLRAKQARLKLSCYEMVSQTRREIGRWTSVEMNVIRQLSFLFLHLLGPASREGMSYSKWACQPLENTGLVAQDRNPEMREGDPHQEPWVAQAGLPWVTMHRNQGRGGRQEICTGDVIV